MRRTIDPNHLPTTSSALARLVLGVAVVFAACGSPPTGAPVASVIPADAAGIVHVSSLAALQSGAAGFASGLEGASGVVDLLAERFGLDLRSDAALDATGLDGRGGLAIFRTQGADVLAVSVHRPDVFKAHATLHLLRTLGARPLTGGAGQTQAFVLPTETTPRVALGVTSTGIGLVVMADLPDEGGARVDADAVWNELARLPADKAVATSPRLEAARKRHGDAKHATIDILSENPFGGLVDNLPALAATIVEALGEWRGGLDLQPTRVGLRLGTDVPQDSALPAAWLAGRGGATPLAAHLPRNTPFFLRFYFNADKLRRLPSFLRDRVVPRRLPGFETAPIPDLPFLVEILGDEIGVALFGLEPGVPLTALLNVNQLLARWPRLFRFGLIARIRDGARLVSNFELIVSQFAGSQDWRIAKLEATPGQKAYTGWTLVQGERSHAVIIDGDIAIFLVGAAELEHLVAVREGRLLPLTASVDPEAPPDTTAITRAALGMSDTVSTIGIHIGFLRVTRELVERGAPPYFVKVLNSIHSVALSFGIAPTAVDIGLEVRL